MWKKSGVWENKKFRLLLILEAALLFVGIAGLIPGDRIVADETTMDVVLSGGEYLEEKQGYYIDDSYGYYGAFLTARPGRLRPGVYMLRIELEADAAIKDSAFEMVFEFGKFHNMLSNPVVIYGGLREQTCHFYVNEGDDSGKITINYGGNAPLLIRKIEVIHTNAGYRILICLTLAGAALVNTLFMLYCYVRRYPVSFDRKLVWIGIPALAVLAAVPLFVDYMPGGADLGFHRMRIEALAQSISEGAIPARVEAMWLAGHGYANAIFYCDTFLVLPALMRLVGFRIGIAYGMYVFAVNLATAAIAYGCFKGCFGDRRVGLFGSMLYTLAPYRIYNIYNRAAVGEYTAMTFLPLLVYGFYRIFTDDPKEKEYRYNWLLPALGFSGLIQSHMLSCEIVGAFTILLCLIMIKKVFRKEIFRELFKTVLGTALLNLWYLVPFLDMMLSGQYKFSGNYGNTIQKRGISPAHIFYTMQAAGSSSHFHENGLLGTEPIGVGLAVLLGAGAFWAARDLFKEGREQKRDRAAIVSFGIGAVSLIISTSYFPWDALQACNKVTGMLVPMIQFPTRLTIVPTVCMTFAACAGAEIILKHRERFWKNAFFAVVCGVSVVFSLYQTNDILMTKEGPVRIYSVENMGHSDILGGEYLPLGTEMEFSYHDAVPSQGVEVISFEKNNLDTITQVNTSFAAEEHWLELPMLLYKGYRAQDVETGELFEIQAGTNNDVRVLLPAGYSGTLHVWYAGMWYWHAAEFVSLAAAAAILVLFVKKRRLKKAIV